MFCTYTAFTILINTLVQLDRVRPAILFSLVSASLKLIVAIVLVGGKSNFPDPTPGFIANIIADGVGALGAVFALGMPSVVRFKRASRQMLNKLLAYGVPLMGVAQMCIRDRHRPGRQGSHPGRADLVADRARKELSVRDHPHPQGRRRRHRLHQSQDGRDL